MPLACGLGHSYVHEISRQTVDMHYITVAKTRVFCLEVWKFNGYGTAMCIPKIHIGQRVLNYHPGTVYIVYIKTFKVP